MIGLIGACFLCGIVVGCMTLTRMGDVVGRKPIYMLGVVMHIVVMVGLIMSYNAYFDFLLVFTFGMSVTARYYVGYAYNLEMQPKSHYVLVSTSMFLIESVVYITICLYFWLVKGPWQLLQVPNLLLSIMGIIFLFFMPESPRFLISKKRFEEARTVFKWIGAKNGLDEKTIEERLDEIVFDGEIRLVTNENAGFDKLLLRVSNVGGEVSVEGNSRPTSSRLSNENSSSTLDKSG